MWNYDFFKDQCLQSIFNLSVVCRRSTNSTWKMTVIFTELGAY